jgi:predicted Zn-dependent protease
MFALKVAAIPKHKFNRQFNRQIAKWVALALCSLVFFGLSGCKSVKTTEAGTVGVDRSQRMSSMVSESQLRQGASQAYREVLDKEAAKGNVNSDVVLTERVRAIARRIIPATNVFRADAPRWQWEVNVIRSDELNAWCMPGGKIAIYTGIITRLNLNDDEIAAIMGHEIAHALREHARERASEQMGLSVVAAGAGIATGNKAVMDATNIALQATFGLPHSRLHEQEADRVGIELAARAGYDPRAAITLWQKMASQAGAKGPQWLSTHPSPQSRIQDLTAYGAKVQPLYDAARTGQPPTKR